MFKYAPATHMRIMRTGKRKASSLKRLIARADQRATRVYTHCIVDLQTMAVYHWAVSKAAAKRYRRTSLRMSQQPDAFEIWPIEKYRLLHGFNQA